MSLPDEEEEDEDEDDDYDTNDYSVWIILGRCGF